MGNIRRVYYKMIEWDLYSGANPMEKVKLPKAAETSKLPLNGKRIPKG